MRVKHGLELRQLGPKSFILEMTSEYKGETSKMITFNSTAAFLWESVKDKDFSSKDLCNLLQNKFSISQETGMEDSESIINAWKQASIVDCF